MGSLLDTSSNDLRPEADAIREVLVGDQKASQSGIPEVRRRAGGIDWTRILGEKGLEAPGYQETLESFRKEKRNG